MEWPLSAFADEISPHLDTQVRVMSRLGVQGFDLRSLNDINVLDLSDADLLQVRKACQTSGLHIQAVGSPVNKVAYSPAERQIQMEKLQRAIHAAEVLQVLRIRIFTPAAEPGQVTEVLDWMAEQIDAATAAGVILLHENDGSFWGAYPDQARHLMESLSGPHFKAVFDFANTVLLGYRPFPDWFPWLLPYLDTLHIKDAIAATRTIVPAGQGDAQMVETLAWLAQQGWHGTLTLEPHLVSGGVYGGHTGEELFGTAVEALRRCVEAAQESA